MHFIQVFPIFWLAKILNNLIFNKIAECDQKKKDIIFNILYNIVEIEYQQICNFQYSFEL